MDKLKQKKKGFTLIELLATIAILAIVSVIVIFTATNVIRKAREKGYLASVTNIEKGSLSYSIENKGDIKWISTDDNNGEYYCVTVKDLIDIGVFDNDVLESEIDKDVLVQEDDYVYLERDVVSKTITRNILLAGKNSDKVSLCNDFRTDGIISFSTMVGWGNNKDVIIDYHILNYKGVASDYEYYYMREDTSEEVRKVFNNSPDMSVKVEEFKAEEINARIYYQNMKIAERTFKTKVDHIKPSLELLVNNGDKYTKNKEVYISLVDNESGFKRGKHRVYYKWSLNDLTCEDIIANGEYIDFTIDANNINKSSPESVSLSNYSGNGKIYACSDSVYDYVGNKLDEIYSADVYLDNDKPIVSLGNYEKNDKARESVRIELLVSDNTSGIKDGSFTKEDLIVKVGDTVIDISKLTLTKKEEGKFELVINNKTKHGEVVITIKEDSVEDLAGNMNDEFEFKPEITFRNVYKINYNANGGTGSMEYTECLYGESCTLSANSFSRTGYTFLGWSESSSATSATYNDKYKFSNYNRTSDMTLYAVWKVHKVIIKYHVNGGSIATASNKNGTWTVKDSKVYRNDSIYTRILNYGATIGTDGLANYNNSSWMNITRVGYTVPEEKEWICHSGCTNANTTFDQDETGYLASDFCDALNGDCTVVLKVNWTPIIYTINYVMNGGSKGTNAPSSGTYDSVLTIDNPSKNVTVTGDANGTGATIGSATNKAQTFAGWTYSNGDTTTAKYGTSSSAVSTGWTTASTKTTAKYFKNLRSTSGTVKLTANWTSVALNLPTVSKVGYTCNWNTEADGSGISYNSGASYNPSATSSSSITVYAQCVPRTYTINYNANGGSSSMLPTECLYDDSCTLSSNRFSRTGYEFLGWSESSSATSQTYGDRHTFSSYNRTSDMTLYAVWKLIDTTPPVCNINVTDSSGNVKITVTSSDSETGISYSGWNSSYSGTNSSSKTVSSTGTYTYYVKDGVGNKNTCSVDISSTYVSKYSKVTKVCNQKVKNYKKTSKTCYQSVSYTCSRAAQPHYSSCTIFPNPGDCGSHWGCSWNGSSCSGSYVSIWSCGDADSNGSGGCYIYNQPSCSNGWGIYQTFYSYYWGPNSNSIVDSCSDNNISCNAGTLGETSVSCVKNYTYELVSNTTSVSSCGVTSSITCSSSSDAGKSYVSSCTPSEYKCSSGVKLNSKYCYKTS